MMIKLTHIAALTGFLAGVETAKAQTIVPDSKTMPDSAIQVGHKNLILRGNLRPVGNARITNIVAIDDNKYQISYQNKVDNGGIIVENRNDALDKASKKKVTYTRRDQVDTTKFMTVTANYNTIGSLKNFRAEGHGLTLEMRSNPSGLSNGNIMNVDKDLTENPITTYVMRGLGLKQ